MAMDLKEFLITLKEKTNIVEVASGYVSLERRGGNHWACCPFHHEKTPSFAINEADQYYHCFACGESGDVIKFVQNMENIEFMDAVKLLAERAKLTLPQTGFDSEQTVERKRKRDAVLNILSECAHFYLKNLNSGNADAHIQYILDRKIPSNIVRKFGLGASLDYNTLPQYLLSKGYSKQDMIDSGAVNEVEGRLSDAQGGRLIYPIIGALDDVIGFGGRILVKKENVAKYKNTKETIVFNKSKTLYNINLLKKLKREQTIKEVIIVEGYMDTISLYQAGFKNVVASMGTSLTQEQARLLKRYTDNVLISYDGDAAGQKANMRGLDILKNEGLNIKVVPLPEGLDPDDVIKQYGAEGYQKCLDSAMPLIDYKLNILARDFVLNKKEDKRRYATEAVKVIRTADSAAEREDLLKRLRDQTGITYESLNRELYSAPQPSAHIREERKQRTDKASMQVKASRFVVAAFLFGAKFTLEENIQGIPFVSEVHTLIAKYVSNKRLMNERVQPAELLEIFEDGTEDMAELNFIFDYSDGNLFVGESAEKYFYDCIKNLRLYDIDQKIDMLQQQIDNESDIATQKTLMAEIIQLVNQKKKIKGGARI